MRPQNRLLLPLLAAALACGCPSPAQQPPPPAGPSSPPAAGAGTEQDPPPTPAAQSDPDEELVIPWQRLKQADADLPRPRELPTIADIDWKAFPDDRSGAYGFSGRQILVKPGKPGAIATALGRAKEGDTILISAGSYREGFPDDDGALRVRRKGVVLRAMPGAEVRIAPQGPNTKRGILVEADNVLVHGLTLEGFLALGIGIGRNGATVKGTIISSVQLRFGEGAGWVDGLVIWPDHRGSSAPAVDGVLLRDIVVQGASLGVSCNAGPCRSLWLERVQVLAARGRGGGSGADAVAVESGENIVLVGVEASGATADGIDIKGERVLIRDSLVHHVSRNGIKLWRGGDVVNTVVHHTGADAGIVLGVGRYRILHSVLAYHNFKGPRSYGLTAGWRASEPAEVLVQNSVFYRLAGGLHFGKTVKARVERCLFDAIGTGTPVEATVGGKALTFEARPGLGRALKRAGLGAGNVMADPRFVDAAQGDFTPAPGSPLLDAGAAAEAGPARDRAGRPRKSGKAPDIGAVERIPEG